jgi:hypothetical protein
MIFFSSIVGEYKKRMSVEVNIVIMNRSDIHLLNLPDEIILIILKKLNNIDVLYSLVDIKNNRLDVLAQDKYFTNTLNLVLSDQMIFDRFCIYILPRIHGNIKYLILESLALKSILLAGSYPNLKNLKLFKFGQDIALQFFKGKLFSSIRIIKFCSVF